MENFKIKIADRVFDISTLFPNTKALCNNYLCKEKADFEIRISDEDIDRERKASEKEQPNNTYSDGYLETLAVYRKIADILLFDDCILMHGAVVAVDGFAYIFTAKSGVGKTTHIRLWQEKFGDRFTIVNGDKPILRYKDGSLFAYGTPWCGKEGLNSNVSFPVKSICKLERGENNTVKSLGFREMLPTLMEQSYYINTTNANRSILNFWVKASKCISFCNLHCNKNPDAADVSYSFMSR